jgi:hypothetical protein
MEEGRTNRGGSIEEEEYEEEDDDDEEEDSSFSFLAFWILFALASKCRSG